LLVAVAVAVVVLTEMPKMVDLVVAEILLD
jgi:hypothetical protein